MDVQLGTISENASIGDCHRCAKFHACIKKCTIRLELCRRTKVHAGVGRNAAKKYAFPLAEKRLESEPI